MEKNLKKESEKENEKMIYESELYHHGILGQKWGKKNGPPYPLKGVSKTGKNSGKKSGSEDNKETESKNSTPTRRQLKSPQKSVRELNDEELANAINRLQMERQYVNLIAAQKSTGEKAAKRVLSETGNVLVSSGKNIGEQLVTYELGNEVNKLLGEDAVNPKKGQKGKK